ncbi:MAG: aminoacyl-tRNA hydrolase [Chloroflexi bacterium]|nr:aminoacyl-tRNA hydrolase [Chloroflexota bacterium]
MPKFRWPPLESIPGLRKRPAERPSLVVVGLGNPGPQYARTRHNVGFWCIDRLAANHAIDVRRRHRTSLIGEGTIGDTRVVLAKPRTFVNRSGDAVRYLLARYRVSPEDVLVVCDDIALDPGKIRLRPSGSAGGHNGLKSIIEALGTQQFPRLRVGIGRPADGGDQIGFVVGTMSQAEEQLADTSVACAAEAVASVLSDGIERAMNRFN